IFRTSPDTTFPESVCLSSSPPNAPPRQSKRQGQRMKRPVAVYNLCLELEDGDSPNSPKEDTPTSSQDSLSSPSPTTAAVHGPLAPDRNHLLADVGTCGDLTATIPGQPRSSMAQWLNPQSPSTSGPTADVSSPFPTSATTRVDKPPESVINRKARAVYPCEAEHSSELSFEIGAIFEDVQTSREPGWLEGTLNGKRGLIPQNYVKLL
ncbi:rho GTPase-activating protein 10, partial [Octodon degus]|uniref:Rho GTPase-activating protein 10 n=1 Tax=Octodon degus TaxID=10160 RepID=A0A6P3FJ86_OCTDE